MVALINNSHLNVIYVSNGSNANEWFDWFNVIISDISKKTKQNEKNENTIDKNYVQINSQKKIKNRYI